MIVVTNPRTRGFGPSCYPVDPSTIGGGGGSLVAPRDTPTAPQLTHAQSRTGVRIHEDTPRSMLIKSKSVEISLVMVGPQSPGRKTLST